MKVTIIEGEFSDMARIACYDYIITKYIKEQMKQVEDTEEEDIEGCIEVSEDMKFFSESEECNPVL